MKNIEQGSAFFDFWFNKLTPRQRKTRIELAFVPIKTVAKKQINLLKKYENSTKPKEVGFLFFIRTVENAWDNIDFAIELGKGRYQRFSYYPTRTVLESLLRLEHYCRQDMNGQNDIALRELLRIAKRFCEREKIDNLTGEPFKTKYEEIASEGSYPGINEANPKDDPFPSMRDLTEKSPEYKDAHLYFAYQALCELTHGKLLAITSSKQDESAEHIRSLMELYALSCNLIKLVDSHVNGITATEVSQALKDGNAIVKKGM